MDSPIFILGCTKLGTTFDAKIYLTDIQIDLFVVPFESHFFSKYREGN